MSLLSSIAPVQAATAASQGAQRSTAPQPATPDQRTSAAAQPRGDATPRAGGTTAGEMAQTASRIPPVTAARQSNAAATTRAGRDGRNAPEAAREAQDQARAEEEMARRRTLLKEMMERIPVPVEALPKLGGDIEVVRSITEPQDHPGYDARA